MRMVLYMQVFDWPLSNSADKFALLCFCWHITFIVNIVQENREQKRAASHPVTVVQLLLFICFSSACLSNSAPINIRVLLEWKQTENYKRSDINFYACHSIAPDKGRKRAFHQGVMFQSPLIGPGGDKYLTAADSLDLRVNADSTLSHWNDKWP